jgi:hypothetical protein
MQSGGGGGGGGMGGRSGGPTQMRSQMLQDLVRRGFKVSKCLSIASILQESGAITCLHAHSCVNWLVCVCCRRKKLRKRLYATTWTLMVL